MIADAGIVKTSRDRMATLVPVLAACLLVAGCGSSSGGGSTSKANTQKAAGVDPALAGQAAKAQTVAQAFLVALAAGNGKQTCALTTKSFALGCKGISSSSRAQAQAIVDAHIKLTPTVTAGGVDLDGSGGGHRVVMSLETVGNTLKVAGFETP